MSLQRCNQVRSLECFPRVSGDEPIAGAFFNSEAMFSPRERG